MLGYLSAEIFCTDNFFFEFWGTEIIQGQISEHIFVPSRGYCAYYPSDIFLNTRSFENW